MKAKLLATNVRKRQERELEKAMRVAKSTIAWPDALQKQRYDKHRDEVESLVELHGKLGDTVGVRTGFNIAVRNFAKQIIRDENSGFIGQNQSREVRTFVRAMNQNYGQFPAPMKRKMKQEMLVSNM